MGRKSDGKRTEVCADRPLREFLLLLPLLPIRDGGEIDYAAADPALLYQIGTNADIAMRTVHRGITAIGRLMVYVAPESDTGGISADAMESLFWLQAELGDLAATAHCLATSCLRYTADYAPETQKHIPPARP